MRWQGRWQARTRAFGQSLSVIGKPDAHERCDSPSYAAIPDWGWDDHGNGRAPDKLRLRSFADLRSWRAVRTGQCPTAVAADAHVRSNLQHFRDRWSAWQGPDRGRAQGLRQSHAGLAVG